MNICPHCGGDLGDLDHINDILALDKLNGKTTFRSICCDKEIEAYSDVGMYYIVDENRARSRQMIGAA